MGKVVYLHNANRTCTDCGCTKAASPAEARRNPDLLFEATAPCGRCDDRIVIELDEADPNYNYSEVCDDCGQTPLGGPEDLQSATIDMGYGMGRTLVLLCPDCLAAREGAWKLR